MKGKSNIVDSSGKYVITADSDSIDPSDSDNDGSDIVFTIVFHCFEKFIQLKITNFLKTLLI